MLRDTLALREALDLLEELLEETELLLPPEEEELLELLEVLEEVVPERLV